MFLKNLFFFFSYFSDFLEIIILDENVIRWIIIKHSKI
jgi:hypothetical protein